MKYEPRGHTSIVNMKEARAMLDYQIKKIETGKKQLSNMNKALACECDIVTLTRKRRTVNKNIIEAECEVKKLKRIYPKMK